MTVGFSGVTGAAWFASHESALLRWRPNHAPNVLVYFVEDAEVRKPLPTIEYLFEWYSYDSETGILSWKKANPWGKKVGLPIGVKDTKGRLRTNIRGRTVAVHHVCWALYYGVWPKDQIDHENRIKTDNNISNLREATNRQNCRNRQNGSNTSGYKGVSLKKVTGKYQARIMVDGKMISLGYFDDPMLGGHAYNKAAIKYHGDFSVLNVVGHAGG